jgi:hypothetical protein
MNVGFLIALIIVMINPNATFMPFSVTDVYNVTTAQHADPMKNSDIIQHNNWYFL